MHQDKTIRKIGVRTNEKETRKAVEKICETKPVLWKDQQSWQTFSQPGQEKIGFSNKIRRARGDLASDSTEVQLTTGTKVPIPFLSEKPVPRSKVSQPDNTRIILPPGHKWKPRCPGLGVSALGRWKMSESFLLPPSPGKATKQTNLPWSPLRLSVCLVEGKLRDL